ncbi:hypothetical protein XBLMG947_4017 [Xanthomonas bromi]|uniref:Uncharacterized protein n=1 Tax=Xanthomonas bromi TaxID=56449 RepID=A0A1C3NS41_9XANT|nr:hypothetical protein XBLMG947_4017 [Xanthomonas bromi]
MELSKAMLDELTAGYKTPQELRRCTRRCSST